MIQKHTIRNLLLLSAISLCITISTTGRINCAYYFEDYNVTFDLSPFMLTNSSTADYYTIVDGSYHGSYDYFFNLCNDVLTIPYSSCDDSDRVYISDANPDIIRPNNTSSMAFQAEAGGNGSCWRLSGSNTENMYNISQNLITYELIDSSDPLFGVQVHYYYGDKCHQFNSTNRELILRFICDPAIKVNDISNNHEITVTEPKICEYEIDIYSLYGCVLECARDNNNTLCYGNGICVYDSRTTTVKCDCFTGFSGDACDIIVPFEGNVTWYKSIKIDKMSEFIFTFETIYGYNVTYDFQYIVNGHMNGKYYVFRDNRNVYNYHMNLFTKIGGDNINETMCDMNSNDYDYGYIYQSVQYVHNVNDTCFSLGRNFTVELYDQTFPGKGIHISYEDGDALYCDGNKSRRSDIYFICPDGSNSVESLDNLNDIYSIFSFNETIQCEYSIKIYTNAACPYQCVTYDDNTNVISQCNTNGECEYDYSLDFIRCICDENFEINSIDDILCYHPSVSPTIDPYNSTMNTYIATTDTYNVTSPYVFHFQMTTNNYTSTIVIIVIIVALFLAVIVAGYVYKKKKESNQKEGMNNGMKEDEAAINNIINAVKCSKQNAINAYEFQNKNEKAAINYLLNRNDEQIELIDVINTGQFFRQNGEVIGNEHEVIDEDKDIATVNQTNVEIMSEMNNINDDDIVEGINADHKSSINEELNKNDVVETDIKDAKELNQDNIIMNDKINLDHYTFVFSM
eukprot:106863_1